MRRFAMLGLALTLAACGGGDDASSNEAAVEAGGDSKDAAPLGRATINGTVSLTGSAPANPVIDMSEEAQCRAKHSGTITDPEYVVADGKVANVFVYVKSGLPAGQNYPVPSQPAVIDQDGCLYEPRVLGVMVGQNLEIKNSDPLLHNIKAVPTANRGFNISQPTEGMTTTKKFTTKEVMVPLECNVHGWMNAFVGVLDHPYFATTDADGRFSIQGLPAGTYEVEAWHEKLGTRTMNVTIGAEETKSADFSFAPTA
jgi:plastocyanin